jgi:predicted NAD-dependent protein-ADP-ribosyltransferase YbiA (DUF1768 family)
MPRTKDDYVFFWKIGEENEWGSQWSVHPSKVTSILQKQNRYPSPFRATIKFPSAEREVSFPTAEHWMMTQKALLFGDGEVAEKVLAIKGSGHKECMKVKRLGREVRGFKEDVWVGERGNSFPRLSSRNWA